MKKAILVAGAAVAMMASTTASAATLLFSIAGSRPASFTLDSNPRVSQDGNLFTVAPTSANIQGTTYNNATIQFYQAQGTAGVDLLINVGKVGTNLGYSGPQLFSGSLSNPVFAPGVYLVYERSNLSGPSILTISNDVASAVPEPATWLTMALGMGAIGFGLRRRQKVSTTVKFA